VIRECISIVHAHATLSALGHEAILHAKTMGLKTVFTDHSLFGFADAGSILANKMLKFTLSDVDHVICVSHTWCVLPFRGWWLMGSKENTVLRAALDPAMVSVIPNAVITDNFQPRGGPYKPLSSADQSIPPPTRDVQFHWVEADLGEVVIVVISRLYYNKGIDLLVAVIPRICTIHPSARFIIAGDGPKFLALEEMREKYMLQDRVEMLGSIRHEEVRDVLAPHLSPPCLYHDEV
jgi:phosphatidylinositol glycan class A protein